jgi:putative endonuclease
MRLVVRLHSGAQQFEMWYLYIVKCSDSSLYTGITTNIENRLRQHNAGLGAKSIKGRLPVSLVHSELYNSHSEALKREAEIKSWERKDKLKLVAGR